MTKGLRIHTFPQLRSSERLDWLAGLVALASSLVPVANSWTPGFPVDDAYISFAYALHLSSGRGLRLSSFGPPVEAFSDPLWVLILACSHLFGLSIPVMAMALNLLLIGLIGFASARLVSTLYPGAPAILRLLPGLAFAILPATAFSVVAGLETLLFAFLLEASIILWFGDVDRRELMGPRSHLCCLLLAMTRPEGVIVWATLLLISLRHGPSLGRHLKSSAWFVVPALAVEALRLLYYGQLTPNSIVAKSGLPLKATLRLDKAEALRFWHEYWPTLVALGLVTVGAWLARAAAPRIRTVSLVVAVLGAFEFAVSSGDNYPYERYLFIGLPLIYAIVAAGAGLFFEFVARWQRPSGLTRWALRVALPIGLAACLLAGTGYSAKHKEFFLQNGDLVVRSSTFPQLGDLLTSDRLSAHIGTTYHYSLAALLRSLPGRPLIATNEVGIVSYYSNSPVMDLYGLGDRTIAQRPGGPAVRSDPGYVFANRPTFIVLLVSGCLCLGLPSDVTYAEYPGMDAYRLAYLMYNGNRGRPPWQLSALVFERRTGIISYTSLEDQVPALDLEQTLMPPQTEQLLDRTVADPPSLPETGIMAPGGSVAAAGTLALTPFQAIRSGVTLSFQLPAETAAGCYFDATAIDTGSGPGSASENLINPPEASSSTKSELSIGQVQNLSVPLPVSPGPVTLTVSSGANTLLAAPSVVCTA